ncbi:tetratricopeptide repeat protein [Anaeromyxobacter sp. PSR-1]|uniref:tetratricopeptide repeat protein n=1 Tax=Anaeromyxobacter sp. PSR-1 TaxID=1300915 RepID=UPI001269B612|nr:tetratricopeptide repeat protein [Anaeromyxobacter sp. PSR-1]
MSASEMSGAFEGPGRHGPYIAALLALGALAWANALTCGFVFDDLPSIVHNPDIRQLGGYLPGGHGYLGRPNRWVGYLTFALNYRAGALAPAGYHAVNVAIHLATACLVYGLAVLLLRTPRLAGSRVARSPRAFAFVAAALFACHPLQAQAVTYVVQRLTSLATLFYVGSVVLYLWARLAPADARRRRVAAYAGSVASAALAARTKEIAVTLPAALALLELAFLDGRPRRRALALTPFALVALSIPLTLIGVRTAIGAGVSDVLSAAASAARVQTTLGRLEYLATETTVVVEYVRLLLLPVGQNVDHVHPTHLSFLDGPVLLSSAGILVAAGLALYAVVRRLRDDAMAALAGFGVLWFLLALSVESSVFPIVDVMNEHRVYLPSVGFFLAAAVAIGWGAARLVPARAGGASVVAGAVLAAVLAAGTQARNRVWESQLTLWADAARKSPGSPRPLNNLGVALEGAGRRDEAEAAFLAAMRIDPGHAESCYNLGRLYLESGGALDDAIALFRRAIALRPDYPEAYANLGAALVRAERYPEAAQVLGDAGAMLGTSAEAAFNLGVARVMLGDAEGARRQIEALRAASPELALRLETFARPLLERGR